MTMGPHILLITTDQLRRDALPLYGNHAIDTPGIDRIARRGTTFDAAYTPSHLCMPARCALLTGRYPHRNGSYSNFRPTALTPQTPTLYNTLRSAGYTTGHIGKCHYTNTPYHRARLDQTIEGEPVKDFILSLGLDHLDLQNGKLNSLWFWNDYSRELEEAGYLDAYRQAVADPQAAKVLLFPGPAQWHPDAWVGRKGVEYLSRLDAAQPSFTWVSFSGPHYPVDPPAEYLDRVRVERLPPRRLKDGDLEDPSKIQHDAYVGGPVKVGCEARQWAPGKACRNYDEAFWHRLSHYYHANVALIDDWVGQLLDAAEKQFGDNLLVVFTADHGEMLGHHGIWAKNRCGYQDVLKIPFTVCGPGFAADTRSHARINHLDLMPTFLEAADADCPPTDGHLLRESIANGGRRYIITEADGFVTIQDDHCKLIELKHPQGNKCELYDLKKDPDEFTNLADDPAYTSVLAELRERVINHFTATCLH